MKISCQIDSFTDELHKIAARAGLKIISGLWNKAQKSFAAGNVSEGKKLWEKANQMAKTPGVLKKTRAGSQMGGRKGFLGTGSEGTVSAVADPKHGLSARKVYNPQGISTNEMIRRKDEVGKALRRRPEVAKYYGQRSTPHGKGTMQFSELIPRGPKPRRGKSYGEAIAKSPDYRTAKKRIYKAHRRTNYPNPQDIRADNMVRDARTGKLRAVDVIPGKKDEFLSLNKRKQLRTSEHNIATTEKGDKLFRDNTRELGQKELLGGMLGGKNVSGLRSRAASSVAQPATNVISKGTPRPTVPRRPVGTPQPATNVIPKGTPQPMAPRRPAGTPQPMAPMRAVQPTAPGRVRSPMQPTAPGRVRSPMRAVQPTAVGKVKKPMQPTAVGRIKKPKPLTMFQ